MRRPRGEDRRTVRHLFVTWARTELGPWERGSPEESSGADRARSGRAGLAGSSERPQHQLTLGEDAIVAQDDEGFVDSGDRPSLLEQAVTLNVPHVRSMSRIAGRDTPESARSATYREVEHR